MPNDRYIIGKGRLVMPDFPQIDEISLARTRTATFVSYVPQHSMARLALAMGRDPVPFLVGYDPQKLLPSPERLYREKLDWYAKLLTANVFTPSEMRLENETIDFDRYGDEWAVERRWHRAVVTYPRDDIEHTLKALAANPRIVAIDLNIEPANPQQFLYASGVVDLFAPGRRGYSIYTRPILPKEVVETARGKRDMGYLKHDPTKKHRRRK